ncbi:MAG: EI24 domain-containing protein [Saprospiraceae bacterium]|nr:EI24 domain-containing protein [Saprospiraceae bacterium]
MITQIGHIFLLFFQTLVSLKSDAIKFLFISGLIALIIFSSMIWVTWHFAASASEHISSLTSWDWALESPIFGIVIGIGVIFVFILIMKYILLIILSPILSCISEKVENNQQNIVSSVRLSFLRSMARSVRINSRNMIRELILTILLLIAGLIPILSVIALPSLFLVQAYFTGFGILDYYLERHQTFSQSVTTVYDHKWAAISLGGIFMLLFAVPVIGVILAPYLATVTGTKYFIKNK